MLISKQYDEEIKDEKEKENENEKSEDNLNENNLKVIQYIPYNILNKFKIKNKSKKKWKFDRYLVGNLTIIFILIK